MRRVIIPTNDILSEVLFIPSAAYHRLHSADLDVSYRLLLVKFHHQPLKGHLERHLADLERLT